MTREMYEKHLPPPSDDGLVLICGPDAMINQTAKPLLVSLRWSLKIITLMRLLIRRYRFKSLFRLNWAGMSRNNWWSSDL